MSGMHRHANLNGHALNDAAREVLTAAGEQWTPMRAGVFEALTSFGQPASAYDIAEALSKTEGRRVAANSVYRILDLFVATNLALRIESKNAYLANAHPECRHDCIFLICDACGGTDHVDDDNIANTVRFAAENAGFAPSRPIIEVRGTCKDCRPS